MMTVTRKREGGVEPNLGKKNGGAKPWKKHPPPRFWPPRCYGVGLRVEASGLRAVQGSGLSNLGLRALFT